MISRRRRRSWALCLTLLGAAAGCGGNPASALLDKPELDLEGQTKCKVASSPDKPLIVEWPAAERTELEAAVSRGATVVRYIGCEMQIRPHCKAPAVYDYVSVTPKREAVRIRDEDELYANMPVYAASLEGALRRSGGIDIDMMIVGRYLTSRVDVHVDELEGECAGATHLIAGITVGAFELATTSTAEVGGGVKVQGAGVGASSKAARETLNADGNADDCSGASDKGPPRGCGALLRLDVVQLAGAGKTKTGKSERPTVRSSHHPAATGQAQGDAAADLDAGKKLAKVRKALLQHRLGDATAMCEEVILSCAARCSNSLIGRAWMLQSVGLFMLKKDPRGLRDAVAQAVVHDTRIQLDPAFPYPDLEESYAIERSMMEEQLEKIRKKR